MRPGLSRCETAMGGKSAEESVLCESRKVEELAPARALLQRCEGRGEKPGDLPAGAKLEPSGAQSFQQ